MSVLERAKAHFAELDRVEIEVPEWGEDGEPLVVYARPLTLADRKKCYAQAKGDDMELLARIVCIKAENEAGEKLFRMADTQELMRSADANIIARIAEKITGVVPSLDDAEKN